MQLSVIRNWTTRLKDLYTLTDSRGREIGTARHDGIALGQTADRKALNGAVSINVSCIMVE